MKHKKCLQIYRGRACIYEEKNCFKKGLKNASCSVINSNIETIVFNSFQ